MSVVSNVVAYYSVSNEKKILSSYKASFQLHTENLKRLEAITVLKSKIFWFPARLLYSQAIWGRLLEAWLALTVG